MTLNNFNITVLIVICDIKECLVTFHLLFPVFKVFCDSGLGLVQ